MQILLFDIETAPNRGWIWRLWDEIRNMGMIEQDWYILCWGAKWLEKKEVMSSALPDFPLYKKEPRNDKHVLQELWKLLDEADVVIGHNAVKFDRRKVNARFMFHGMKPPSPYMMIDTLLVARKEFDFSSNKLNDIVVFLGLGKKIDTGGFELWTQCLDGIMSAWRKMVKYCKHDVTLLEKVYLALRPYMLQHPNIGVYNDDNRPCCPKCGCEKIHYRGYYHTTVSRFKRFKCLNPTCGGWGRERKNLLSKDKRQSLTTNAL